MKCQVGNCQSVASYKRAGFHYCTFHKERAGGTGFKHVPKYLYGLPIEKPIKEEPATPLTLKEFIKKQAEEEL